MKRVFLPLLIAAALPAWAQHATPTEPTTQTRADPNTPRPPEDTSSPMSMPVEDNMIYHQVLLDEIEYTHSKEGNGIAWDLQGWIGRDYNRLWVKSEGARIGGRTEDGRLELLWSKPVRAFWDMQAGVRHDFGGGPTRNWLALGIQGLAPYWFDLEGTAYVGESGRAALRLDARYDVRLTQRTYLTPRLETNLYSRSDPERRLGSGLSDASFGLRLRHEFSRQFAPYIGVVWEHRFGGTADQARASNSPVTQRQWVAGVRAWF